MTENPHSLAGRVGAYAKHARHDPNRTAAIARAGNERKWRAEAEANIRAEGLEPTEAEVTRRASYIRQREMTRLSLRSAQARAAKKAKAS
jgi:hypothetical protein